MKDCSNFVINVYSNLIDGITVGSNTISLYDRVMGDHEDKYIVFDDISITDISDMQNHQFIVSVDLQIITIFREGDGGKKTANNINNEILQTLYGATEGQTSDNEFRIYDTLMSNSFIREEDQQGIGYVVRKFVTIQHLVEQK